MILFKSSKLGKFCDEIQQICKENSYEVLGDLRKSFVVRTPKKTYNVSVLSTYRFKNSGITFISDKSAQIWSQIPLLKGFGGGISFPLYKSVDLPSFESTDETENIIVIYPKCMTIQLIEHETEYNPWTPGKKIGNIRIFDGSSFKDELKNLRLYTDEKQSKHSAAVSAIGC